MFVTTTSSLSQHDEPNNFFNSNIRIPIFVIHRRVYTFLLSLMQDDYLVNIQTHVVITTSHTYNIICEWKYGDDSNRIVVGSHLGMCMDALYHIIEVSANSTCLLDSVDNSPGINAGSGAATTLAIALALSSLRYQPTNKLVFAWWGAKEAGDSGILHYLNSLNDEQVSNTAAHINIDIIGSQNYIPYVSE